jgi:hypothetical protein
MSDAKPVDIGDLEALKIRHEKMEIEPWAKAMLRYIEARVASDPESSLYEITERDLQMLFIVQNYRCAITQKLFIEPPSSKEIKRRAYANWLRGLPEGDRDLAPVPVCVTEDKCWKFDTIMLVTYPISEYYRSVGGHMNGLWNSAKDIVDRLTSGCNIPLNDPDSAFNTFGPL